jgi:hypothetical protein
MIQDHLQKPIEIGDIVIVRGLGPLNKKAWGNSTKVVGIGIDGNIFIKDGKDHRVISKDDYKKYTYNIGANPFDIKPFHHKLRHFSFDIGCILSQTGFDRHKKVIKVEYIGDVSVDEINANPFIIDKNGEKIFYQRGLCWSLQQRQALIQSIYQNISIGTVTVRNRSWKWIEQQIAIGEQPAFKDIVDGKQRLHTLVEFITDKFTDAQGNYFSDLSDQAQHKFFSSTAMTYYELSEDVSDKDVIDMFLSINIAGVKIDLNHINFVKSINI